MQPQKTHAYYMKLALELAAQARGQTAPNPMVGCVIVHNEMVIGEGFHQQSGRPHAEINAIQDAMQNNHGKKLSQSTCYVTLEPCCHYGKTGPCVDQLIKHQFKTVVVAMQDPNPLVAGKGIELLKKAGIEVVLGVEQEQAELLNQGFISRVTKNRPFIRSKIAASLDGHIALNNGESKWVTNELARADVHQWRAASDAIVTTAATVNADNPSLTVRLSKDQENKQQDTQDVFSTSLAYQQPPKQPIRVIIDKDLTTTLSSTVYKQEVAKTIVITSTEMAEHPKIELFAKNDIQVYFLPLNNNKLPINELWKLLADLGCNDVFIEAGGNFNGYLLSNNANSSLVDEWLVYQSGIIMGSGSKNMFNINQQQPASSMDKLFKLNCKHIKQLGDNWCIMFTQE